MSLFSHAILTLNNALLATAGETIAYRRGDDVIEVPAIPVRTRFDEIGPEETNITLRERDWIVWAEDLILDDERLTPQLNDQIEWVDPLNVTRKYRVRPRIDDRCFRHTDVTCQQLRIYTVEVSSE